MLNSFTRFPDLSGAATALISISSGFSRYGRGAEVAHQRRDARVRLRVARHVDLRTLLADALEVDALGQLAQELVEQLHGLRAVALEAFDHLFLGQQRGGFLADLADFLDLLVELGDLALHVGHVGLLLGDLLVEEEPDGACDEQAEHQRDAREHAELLLATLARFLAVRK